MYSQTTLDSSFRPEFQCLIRSHQDHWCLWLLHTTLSYLAKRLTIYSWASRRDRTTNDRGLYCAAKNSVLIISRKHVFATTGPVCFTTDNERAKCSKCACVSGRLTEIQSEYPRTNDFVNNDHFVQTSPFYWPADVGERAVNLSPHHRTSFWMVV